MKLKAFLATALSFLRLTPKKPAHLNTPPRSKRLGHSQRKRKRPHLIAKYGMKCFWCGCDLLPETLTIDHYIPLSKGGTNKIKNLRLACDRCNNKRKDAMPEDTPHIINVPKNWQPPKHLLGQKVKQGQIVGVIYHPLGTLRAKESGEKWTYFVLEDDCAYEIDSYLENEIDTVLTEESSYAVF